MEGVREAGFEEAVDRQLQAERERRARRLDAAARRGWKIRHDPVQLEFTAARELHTAKTVDGLLDEIDEADGEYVP